MMRLAGVCLLAGLACVARGQEFEVVSVKPNQSGDGSSRTHSDRGRMTATNVSLRSMILMAYALKEYQLVGPDWLSSVRFDINAKFPEAFPAEGEEYRAAYQTMMQKMLADRFKLTVHRSEKSFSVYGLVAAKNGIKFKEVPDTGSHNSSSSGTKYTGTCVNMENLAAFLSRRVELPVLDMTGLKGYYDLKMEWAEEPKTKDGAPADPPNGPALTTALQEQLGLKLEPRKVPLDLLTVDHAEKMPTEN